MPTYRAGGKANRARGDALSSDFRGGKTSRGNVRGICPGENVRFPIFVTPTTHAHIISPRRMLTRDVLAVANILISEHELALHMAFDQLQTI